MVMLVRAILGLVFGLLGLTLGLVGGCLGVLIALAVVILVGVLFIPFALPIIVPAFLILAGLSLLFRHR